MSAQVFERFAKMIADLPVEAVLKALDIEYKMLVDDVEHKRLDLPEEAFSIICFRQFVRMVRFGEAMQPVKSLSQDHLEFYKETIVRLVHAKELPSSAMEQFD